MPLFIKRLSKVSFYSHAQNYEMGLSVKNRAYPQCFNAIGFIWHRLIALNPSLRFWDGGCVPIKTKISI